MQIEKDKATYDISGGCTALMVLFLQGNLYVGNAGDSRWDSDARHACAICGRLSFLLFFVFNLLVPSSVQHVSLL